MSASSDEAFVLKVLDALEQTRLEAIVVGSVAAVLQGSPVTTQDLDLLVRDTPTNRQKIERKTSPSPQLAGVTVSSARLRLLGCRGQRDRAWVGDGGQGGSLQVRGGIFAA